MKDSFKGNKISYRYGTHFTIILISWGSRLSRRGGRRWFSSSWRTSWWVWFRSLPVLKFKINCFFEYWNQMHTVYPTWSLTKKINHRCLPIKNTSTDIWLPIRYMIWTHFKQKVAVKCVMNRFLCNQGIFKFKRILIYLINYISTNNVVLQYLCLFFFWWKQYM